MSEKTEEPTGKRLEDARKQGQVARSRDLALAAASVAATVALARYGGHLLQGLGEQLAKDLAHFGDKPLAEIGGGDISAMVVDRGLLLATLVAPIALSTMFVGVFVHGVQGGVNFAPGALTPSWTRLNPANGLRKLGLTQSGADTIKALLSVAVIAWIAWRTVDAVIADSLGMAWMSPLAAADIAWSHTRALLWRIAWGLGLFSIGDYALQRYRIRSSLKMSKQEIIDEAKDRDGNPEVKGKIRRMQREMLRRRMIRDVERATVVITNPTHFAVALEYRRGAMAAPVVLAKGADVIARKIREAAIKHGVPIVENKPLAQALYKTTEVGDVIPAQLFTAVAEILAQLVRLKRLAL